MIWLYVILAYLVVGYLIVRLFVKYEKSDISSKDLIITHLFWWLFLLYVLYEKLSGLEEWRERLLRKFYGVD